MNSMTELIDNAEEYFMEDIERDIEQSIKDGDTWDETLENIANADICDSVHDIADSCSPIYTADILDCAKSDLWLATTTPECRAFGGEATAVNIIVGNIYEKICEHLYEREADLKRKVLDNYKNEKEIENESK